MDDHECSHPAPFKVSKSKKTAFCVTLAIANSAVLVIIKIYENIESAGGS